MTTRSGWPIRRLDQVAEVRLGRQRSPRNHSGDSMRPYLRAANVTWSGLSLGDVKFMNFTDEEMETYRLRRGDVVLGEASGSADEVGKPALWRGEIDDCAFQNTLLRVRPDPDLDPSFLLHWLRSLAVGGQFAKASRGVGIHHIGRAKLASWPVPVPPIEEQRRIVDILEDHLSRLDAADAGLRTVERRLRAWREGWIDRLVWREDWPLRTVASLLAEPLRNGHSARASSDGTGIRTLTLTAVTTGKFVNANTKVTAAERSRVSELWLRPGDILVQRSNTPELVGTTAHYDGPSDWAIFPDLLIRARVNDRDALSRFVAAAMASPRAHRWLRSRAKGLAGSMPKIDQTTIGRLELPVPTLDTQRLVIAELDKAAVTSIRLRETLKSSHQRTVALKRALLQAAFSGRLTSRTSNDELEEITGEA